MQSKIFFRKVSRVDGGLVRLGRLLGSFHRSQATFAMPAGSDTRWLPAQGDAALDPRERAHAAGLMRVNHVGEVCAQALYQSQAATARHPERVRYFLKAAGEEADHLEWTSARIAELGGRPSLLVPLWFAGAYGIGLVAGLAGDRASLGFMVETERQVEAHLDGHLSTLPERDLRSRAIVARMKEDEARHADSALEQGGLVPPAPLRWLMKGLAKVMTTTAYRL